MGINNFDRIASSYDGLAKLVFGNTLLSSQIAFLNVLTKENDILILGGGTGKILELIPPVRSIDYVEKSHRMIDLAKRRGTINSVSFIYQDFFEFQTQQKYDAIICPFFLDCFNEINLEQAIDKLKTFLRKDGNLFVTDFEIGLTNKTLSYCMHLFFRITANLESRTLQPIHKKIISLDFELKNEKFFNQKMIFSRVYRNL